MGGGFRLPGLARNADGSANWRSITAAVAVLTLATTGNAILPIPYAFAIAGAVAASLIIFFVALSNVFTCKLLLDGAVATGAADFEQLAFAVGGFWLRLWSEAWIVVLLIGTNIGAIIQMGEAFGYAVVTQWPDAPNWLWDRSGTAAMLFLTLCVIFPLSMLPRMRSLEMVGNCGVLILFAVCVIVMVKAISNGMPALASGDFPSVSSGDLTSITETFSLLCFAFYHQVMMMPMLSEARTEGMTLEASRVCAKDLHAASSIVILGTSGLYYWFTGFFGASMYGATNISDNLLNNIWLPGVGTFILNLTVTIYLAISIPPIFHACNHTVDSWLRQMLPRHYAGLKRPWMQRLIVNCCTILPCLGVAMGVPGESGTVLSVTGATGVVMCSYIMPVIFHFMLYFGKARCMRMGKPNASFGGAKAPPVVETGAPTGAIAASVITDLPPPEIGDSVESGDEFQKSSPDASAALGKKIVGDPEPDAPPGLMCSYRKQRHPLVTAGYDMILPLLVVALGCFFSVTTLILLFKPNLF